MQEPQALAYRDGTFHSSLICIVVSPTDSLQIDYIEPTLVILGSRGRSALKGVLLGSFSNYLVTKSSVPVMVARKKLKQHTKQKKKGNVFAHGTNSSGPVNVRLANNLITGFSTRNLASAKVD